MGKGNLDDKVPAAENFMRLVEGFDEGILSLDRSLRVTYANPAAAAFLKIDCQALAGKPIGNAVPGPLGKRLSEKVSEALTTGSALTFEETHRHPMLSCRILPAEHGVTVALREITGYEHEGETVPLEGEAGYRFVTERMKDVIWVVDNEFKVLFVTPSVERLLGFASKEAMALGPKDRMTPESYAHALEIYQREIGLEAEENADPDRTLVFHLEYRHKDGSTVWTENIGSLLHDQSGRVIGVHAVCRDITKRKEAEELRRLLEGKFQAAFEVSPHPVAITDVGTGLLVDVNSAFLSQTGLSRDEAIGKSTLDLGIWVDPADRRRVYKMLIAGTPVNGIELKLHRKDGEIRDVEYWVRLMDVGNKKYAFTLAKDITEEKLAAQKLRESQERLSSVTDNLPRIGIYSLVFGPEHQPRFLYISAGIELLTGVAQDKALKDAGSLYRLIVHDDLMEVLATEAHALTNLEPFECEVRLKHAATCEVIWVLLRSIPSRNPDGTTVWNGVMMDINRQKKAELALRESEAKFRFITEKISDVVWTRDTDFRTTYITPSVEKLLGFTPEERMGQDPREIMTPESFNHATEIFLSELGRDGQEGVDLDRSLVFETEFYHKDGSTVWCENHANFIRDETGKVIGIHAVTRDITERKKGAELLRLSEQKFEYAFQSSPDAMAITDLETGLMVNVNSSFQRWSGFAHEETVGMSTLGLDMWADPGDRIRMIEILKAGRPVNGYELKLRRKDGEIRDTIMSASILDVGDRHYLFSLAHDVTEEKAAARKLRESEELLRSVSDNLPQVTTYRIVFDADNQAHFEYISAGVELLQGISHEEVMRDAQVLFNQVIPEDIEKLREAEMLAHRDLTPFDCEVRTKHHASGEIRWLHLRSTPLRKEDGSIAWNGVALDVTEQKWAEQALRESEAKFRFLAEKMSDVISTSDENFEVTYISPSVEKIIGYTPEEIMGRDSKDLMTPESYSRAVELYLKELGRDGLEGVDPDRSVTFELEYYHKNGSMVWAESIASFIRDETGKVIGIHEASRDITEKKRAAELLKTVEQRFESAFQLSPDIMVIIDLETRLIVDANPSFLSWIGFSRDEVIGKSTAELGLWVDAGDRVRMIESLKSGVPVNRLEVKARIKDGTLKDMLFWARPMEIGGKQLIFVLVHDVTEEKAAERKLKESEELLRSVSDNLPQMAIFRNCFAPDDAFQTHFHYISAGIEGLAGISPDMVLRDAGVLYDLVLPEDLSGLLQAQIHAHNTLTPFEYEMRSRHPDTGAIHWVFLRSVPTRTEEGATIWNGIVMDITERRKLESELQVSMDRFRVLSEATFEGIIISEAGIIIDINDQVALMLGYSRHELMGLEIRSLIPPEDIPIMMPRLAENEEQVVEHRMIRKDGSLMDVEVHGMPWTLRGRSVRLTTIRDITGRRKAEQALRESEERLGLAMNSAGLGMWDSNAKTGTVTFSHRFKEIFGLPDNALLSCRTFPDHVHPDDHAMVSEAIRRAQDPAEGSPYDIQYRARWSDGTVRWVSSMGKSFFEELGGRKTFTRFIGTVMDITDLKDAEKALRESEGRLRQAQTAGRVGVFDWDLASRKVVLVDSSRTIIDQGEVCEETPEKWAMLLHPEDMPLVDGRLRQAIRDRVPEFTVEHRLLSRGSEPRWFSSRAYIQYDEAGRAVRLVGTTMDINELKHAQEALLKANEDLERKVGDRTRALHEANRVLEEQKEVLEDVIRMRERMEKDIRRLVTAIDQAQDAILLISPNLEIKYVNPAFEKMSGYARIELIGHEIGMLRDYLQSGELPNMVETVQKRHMLNMLGQRRRKKNGEVFYVNSSISPVFDDSGEIIDYVTVGRDITHEIHLQEQINQIQKMDAVGAMAAGVAYDLRNTLTPILINTRMLLENIRPDDPALHFAGEILRVAHEGLDLVDQLLTLSRSEFQEKKPVVISTVIREALSILKSTLPSTVVIRHDLGTRADMVQADPVQIKQVLISLADNAVHAMRERKGLLSIRLARKELRVREIRKTGLNLAAGTYAQIMVRDTGEGMDEETLPIIFEPSFTTREPGRGVGLGLPVALGIVTSHQGAITVSSKPGKGSTFTVYLPVMPSWDLADRLPDHVPEDRGETCSRNEEGPLDGGRI
jgi:PAS domain S-box-containing protein